MREIGGAITRADDILLAGVEQSIHLVDKRLDLIGDLRRQMCVPPGADIGDAAAQRVERTQADADLNRGCRSEHQPKEPKRQHQVAGKSIARRRHAREIFRHGNAHRYRFVRRSSIVMRRSATSSRVPAGPAISYECTSVCGTTAAGNESAVSHNERERSSWP